MKAPRKRCHYVDSSDSDSDVNVLPKSTKQKKTSNAVFSGIGQRVEVRYDDGVWYKGTLVNFDVSNGQWKVEFDDDDEEASGVSRGGAQGAGAPPLSLRNSISSYSVIKAYINSYHNKPLFGDKIAMSSFIIAS